MTDLQIAHNGACKPFLKSIVNKQSEIEIYFQAKLYYIMK